MSEPSEANAPESSRLAVRRIIRVMVATLVCAGLAYKVWRERAKLGDQTIEFNSTHFFLAGIFYVGGLSTCAIYWYLAMRDCESKPTKVSTLTAYFVGHLAKYVPGKGLVLVVRSGLVVGQVQTSVAAMTSFQESILMMATGALVAAVLSLADPIELPGYPGWFVPLLSIGIACGLGFLATPPVSRWLGRTAMKPFKKVDSTSIQSSGWRVLCIGAVLIVAGWFLLGTSFGYVLAGLGQPESITGRVTLLTMIIALATVGGFVSGLPGGLGLRELILVEALEPYLVGMSAITAAVMLRLVWIAAEVVISGLLTCFARMAPASRKPEEA